MEWVEHSCIVPKTIGLPLSYTRIYLIKKSRLNIDGFEPSNNFHTIEFILNQIDFAVTSLLKMSRSFGSHAIHSILGYIACLFSMVPYACVVLHASSFKQQTIHACCHWVHHWQNPSKDQDP